MKRPVPNYFITHSLPTITIRNEKAIMLATVALSNLAVALSDTQLQRIRMRL